ncbi:hypothetical protein [Yoonia sp. 2307UL14-13]|uniref:hypothetical protein n=1 Tax=Yoonia sp. 2307UL14-13 TaxID=3126506 RepID=UPI0030998D75
MSHRYQFVLFPDPLNACPWVGPALRPWLDQPVASSRNGNAGIPFFHGMSPAEARLAFDVQGLNFGDYTRIAIIRNPYAKMAQLYYRIAMTDPLWRMRDHVGIDIPRFGRWLRMTRPDGLGAGYRGSARWRRFGAWSAEHWCGPHVTHTVRADAAAEELTTVFDKIGISPAFGDRTVHEPTGQRLARLYDSESWALIRQRYRHDLLRYRMQDCQRPLRSLPVVDDTVIPYRSVA